MTLGTRERGPVAWVLNLEAEHELERGGAPFTPTRHLARIVARERRRLVGTLVQEGDVVLGEPGEERADGLPGLAWSPTPDALAQLARAGARPPLAPEAAVLRAVNARPFALDVRAPLVERSFAKACVDTLEAALEALVRPAPLGWLVRRSFGAAGRGRRRLRVGAPDAAERAWLVASLRLGPLVIEPWVEVTREYTRSGFVTTAGEVVVHRPCLQSTTREGAWIETVAPERGDVARTDDDRLEQAAVRAGEALAARGYFGPFGIDAFRHRVPGRPALEVLNPLSEINARFTMDWRLGMEDRGERWIAEVLAEPAGASG